MNKKGISMLDTIVGAIIGIVIFSIFSAVFWREATILAQEKGPDAATISSLRDLTKSIEENEKNQIIIVQGDYYMTFFDKGSDKGLSGFYRPGICFDKNSACICLCYTQRGKEENYCSNKDNKELTKCEKVDVDKFILVSFNEGYINKGVYDNVSLLRENRIVKLINNK